MPDSPSRPFDLAAWLPARKALLWVLLAFVAGLLLFVLVWARGRDEAAGIDGDTLPAATVGEEYEALPAPLPARRGTERVERPPPQRDDRPQPRLVEAPPPPPPQPTAPAEAPPPAPAATGYVSPQPIPGQTPSPQYPPRALRRRESGTVTIRAEIGPDGVPVSVGVERSSGSRALDRAAEDAVRRWRFQPALRDGEPTTGSVVVPISFTPR